MLDELFNAIIPVNKATLEFIRRKKNLKNLVYLGEMVSPPRGYTKILLSYNAAPMDEISTFAFMNYVIIELSTS